MNSRQNRGSGQELVQGSLVISLGLLLSTVFQLLNSVIIARTLLAFGAGYYSLVTRIAALVLAATSLGLPTSITYHVARDENGEKVGALLGTALLLALGFAAVALVVSFLLVNGGWILFNDLFLTGLLLIAFFGLPFSSTLSVLINFARGLNRFKLYSAGLLLVPVIAFGALLVLVFTGIMSIWTAVLTSVFANVLTFLVVAIASVGHIRLVRTSRWAARSLAIIGLPLAVGGVFSTVLDSVGVIVLQALQRDIVLVGLFSYAYQLGTSLHFLIEPVSLALLPIVTRLIERRDFPSAQRILGIGLKLVFLLLPILVLVALFSQEALFIIYGPDFVSASPMLVVLLLGSLPLSAYYLFSRALLARGRSLLVGSLIAVSASLNVILAVFLVLILGGLGAAMASTITFSLMALLSFSVTRRFKELRFALPRRSWSGPLIISCSAVVTYFAFSLLASFFPVPYLTWVRACVVILCVIVSTLLVKPLSAEEFVALRKTLSQGIPSRLARVILKVLSLLARADHES